MYDWYLSHYNAEDFTKFDLDDVDNAFDKVVQVKYSQSVPLKGMKHFIQVTIFIFKLWYKLQGEGKDWLSPPWQLDTCWAAQSGRLSKMEKKISSMVVSIIFI